MSAQFAWMYAVLNPGHSAVALKDAEQTDSEENDCYECLPYLSTQALP